MKARDETKELGLLRGGSLADMELFRCTLFTLRSTDGVWSMDFTCLLNTTSYLFEINQVK